MFGDELPGQALGSLGQFPELSRSIGPDHCAEFVLILTLPAAELPTITPRSTPARFACFKQYHIVATLGEMQRRRQTGITGADNTGVGAAGAIQRG